MHGSKRSLIVALAAIPSASANCPILLNFVAGIRNGKARGAFVVCVTWTVRDNSGQLLPRFVGGSRFEVGRKLLGNRYDAFRLQVSSSYREIFDRELRNVLEREDWQIVPLASQRRTRGASSGKFI